jgi:L-histidine N-alpha-methyltransferase
MHLRAREAHTVHVKAIGIEAELAAGEMVRTEISAKFRREKLAPELASAGFRELGWWTDAAGDFALSLWQRS